MPKLRVFELAQELKKTNKEVIDFLKENNVSVKSHMSTLEEKDQKMVRDSFSGNDENKDADKKSVKKKTNLIQVHRPQNAMTQEGKNFRKNSKPAQGRSQNADAAKDGVAKDGVTKDAPVRENNQNRNASSEGRKFNNNRQNQGQSQERPERRDDRNRRSFDWWLHGYSADVSRYYF